MDRDEIWRLIDRQRLGLADLFEELTDEEWATASLCAGWRVRDVAAHLTLAHMGAVAAAGAMVRAGGSFDRMIHDSAVRRAELPVTRFGPMVRDMVGSRRTAPGISDMEPLIDVLVHEQDIARPLGRVRTMPTAGAAAAAERVWALRFPFRARRRLAGYRLRATDCDFAVGSGEEIDGPVAELLMLMTGRAPSGLSGDGARRWAAESRESR